MTAACFDFPAINQRLRQMRGEAYSGRYFAPVGDGRYQLVESGHDWDWCTDRCARCHFDHMEIEDNIGPKVCPGGLPKVRTKYYEDKLCIRYMLPNGMRELELKPVSLEDQWDAIVPMQIDRAAPQRDARGLRVDMPMIPYAPPRLDLKAMADINALYREMFEGIMGSLLPKPFVPYMEIDK